MNRTRTLLALALMAVASPVLLAACGGVPSNSVAKVADAPIKKSEFDHWLNVAALSQGTAMGATSAAPSVPDAPNFTKCVAQKQKTQPKPAKGQPAPAQSALKKQCQQEYDSLRDQVLQFLISAQWIQGEASDQKVSVSDADVNKQFEETKKQSFPKPEDFDKFLKQSGMTQEDILYRVRVSSLSDKLREKITKGKDKVTPQQIQQYYDKNKQQFAQPERRDLQVILTKDEATAKKAMAAARGDFKAAAKKYSIDPQTKQSGGALMGVTKGQQDKALDAAFSAPKGKLTGPVKGQFGWYVFEVSKVTPASQQTLQQATPTIRQTLVSQGQQKALADFVKSFRKKWKERTDCREGFVVPDCKQGKEPKGGADAAGGQQGAPQGGQAPPQGGQVPPQGGQVPPQGGQVPPQGGQVPPQGGQVPPQGGQVPPQGGGQVPPSQGGGQAPPPTP